MILNSKLGRHKDQRLVLNICQNIISNPSEISQCESINWDEVYTVLTNSQVALKLLSRAGFYFETYNDKKRLIWNNTHQNTKRIKYIHFILDMNEVEINSLISLIKE